MFGGDLRLKAIIQILSASYQDREIIYCTFGKDNLGLEIEDLVKNIQGKTVSEVYKKLISYKTENGNLFKFLIESK